MSTRRDRDKKDDRDTHNDNGTDFLGLALAGIGIGAAIYGASKLFGSGSSSQSDHDQTRSQSESNKKPSQKAYQSFPSTTNQQISPDSIDVIETEDECVRAITRIER